MGLWRVVLSFVMDPGHLLKKRKVKSVRRLLILRVKGCRYRHHLAAHEEHGAPHVHVCKGDLQLGLRGLLQRDANQAYNHMHSKKGLKIDQAHTHTLTDKNENHAPSHSSLF